MDLREALVLVANDVDRSRMTTAPGLRARGERIVRRRRAVAAAAASAAVLLVAVVLVASGGVLRAHPRPVQPPTPHPVAATVVLQGCGHGVGCPVGQGPFRAVLDSGRGGAQLTVIIAAPCLDCAVRQQRKAV